MGKIVLVKSHDWAREIFVSNINSPLPLSKVTSIIWDAKPHFHSYDRLEEIVSQSWDIFTGLYDDRGRNYYPSCDSSIRSIKF